ncbi:MAG: hypothetical protein ACOYMR_16400 [Ilumatobacteraceae bacterium]
MTESAAPLPIDVVDEPLRAFKFAELRGGDLPRFHPSGRYRRHPYPHDRVATAVCHRQHHPAPTVDCECGFHAVSDPASLPEVTDHHPHMVLLEVELDGMIVEHESGMRAEQQRILGVFFPEGCASCRRHATHVLPGRVWRSLCADCAAGRPAALSRADATARLGVDVGFSSFVPARMPKRAMHAVRAASMVALMVVCAVLSRRAHPGAPVTATMVALVAAAVALAVGILTTRLTRRRETLFQLQCLCLTAGSFAIILST